MTPASLCKSARNKLGLTQAEFAALCGVSTPAISDIERGDTAKPNGGLVSLFRLMVHYGQESADVLKQ